MDKDNYDNGTYIVHGWDIKDRLKHEDRIAVEKRIKERQETKIDTIKEQEIPYEILEKKGTTYKFDKGDDEHRR